MMELVDSFLDYAYNQVSDEQLVLVLSVRVSSTCWNSILTQEEKDKLVFIGKYGECKAVHEYPKCDKCRTIRMQSGKCQSCCYTKLKENYYSSYCGNCFQVYELPNCVECQHYRLKAGRCKKLWSNWPRWYPVGRFLFGWGWRLWQIDVPNLGEEESYYQDEFQEDPNIWQLPFLQRILSFCKGIYLQEIYPALQWNEAADSRTNPA